MVPPQYAEEPFLCVGVPAEPAPQPAPPSPAGCALWNELVEQYKNKLTPMYWFMLDDARGFLEGDEMVVRCGDGLTLESLDNPEVAAVIREATGAKLGREIRVRFALGGVTTGSYGWPGPSRIWRERPVSPPPIWLYRGNLHMQIHPVQHRAGNAGYIFLHHSIGAAAPS